MTITLLRGLARAASCIVLGWIGAGCTTPGAWRKVPTPDGLVWRADRGLWRAEVEPSRGRLTFLGPVGGKNFLNRPPSSPSGLEFGGHRAWIGPQTEWKAFWPPPANWEMSPAQAVTLRRGQRLEVLSPQGSDEAPAIRRTYRWRRDGLLECEMSWREKSAGGRQAINIFQVSNDAIVEARARPSPAARRGFVLLPIAGRPGVQAAFPLPTQITVQRDRVLLRRGRDEEKVGFLEQTLIARWPQGEMRLHPGHIRGVKRGEPEKGFRAQVYLGSGPWPVVEIEQLSPRLRPRFPSATVGQAVRVELIKNP